MDAQIAADKLQAVKTAEVWQRIVGLDPNLFLYRLEVLEAFQTKQVCVIVQIQAASQRTDVLQPIQVLQALRFLEDQTSVDLL